MLGEINDPGPLAMRDADIWATASMGRSEELDRFPTSMICRPEPGPGKAKEAAAATSAAAASAARARAAAALAEEEADAICSNHAAEARHSMKPWNKSGSHYAGL